MVRLSMDRQWKNLVEIMAILLGDVAKKRKRSICGRVANSQRIDFHKVVASIENVIALVGLLLKIKL